MEKIYVDTNIFLDALLDRKSSSGRDLGTPAMSIFSQADACRFTIILSDWTLEELYCQIDEDSVKSFFSDLEHKIIHCEYTEAEKKEAKANSNHWQDYLHGIIAEREGADCIITRNVKDLRTLSGVNVKLPSHI